MNPGSRRHDTKTSQKALNNAASTTIDNLRIRMAYARGHRLQDEVASAIGVSPATISNIETGEVNVSEKLVRKYVEYLGIPRRKEFLKLYVALNDYLA
jgi:DNA-binding XRE family transcriptional regulator